MCILTSHALSLAQALVKRENGIGEILARIGAAILAQPFHLLNQRKRMRNQIHTIIDIGRLTDQNAAHEALCPCEIIAVHRRRLFCVRSEHITTRGTEARDLCCLRGQITYACHMHGHYDDNALDYAHSPRLAVLADIPPSR